MKYNIFTFFIVLLIWGCKKDKVGSILDGKIKTLDWYDPSNALLASYSFIYDENTGDLLKVKNDTSDYLHFTDFTSTSIRMNYYETIIGIPSATYKRAYFDIPNKFTSLYSFDTASLTDGNINYFIHYNSGVIDSISEAYQPFVAFPSSKAPKNNQYVFDGNNYIEFQSTWGGIVPPIIGSYILYHDTIKYTYSSILNDGQIPLQFPFRTYKWNSQNDTHTPRASNILYMLGIKGINTKMNKNLIQTITFSGSEYYTINFDYIVNGEGQVIQMNITDRQNGIPEIFTFKMTYY